MRVKTTKLTGAALNWAVALCEKVEVRWSAPHEQLLVEGYEYNVWQPHKSWSQAGPIIERENITLVCCEGDWVSGVGYSKFWVAETGLHTADEQYGPQGDYWGSYYEVPEDAIYGLTPLVAAMRCFVASKLGDFVEVPDELA